MARSASPSAVPPSPPANLDSDLSAVAASRLFNCSLVLESSRPDARDANVEVADPFEEAAEDEAARGMHGPRLGCFARSDPIVPSALLRHEFSLELHQRCSHDHQLHVVAVC